MADTAFNQPNAPSAAPPAPPPPPQQNAPPAAPRSDVTFDPQGAGQPQRFEEPSREPYFLLTPNRPASEWGQPNFTTSYIERSGKIPQAPWAPQPHDVNPLIHQITSGFANFGSDKVKLLALAAGRGGGAFLKAYMQSQDWVMRREREARDEHLRQIEETALAELRSYSEVLSDESGFKGEALKQELWNRANQLGDSEMRRRLSLGNWEASAKELMHIRDNTYQPLMEMRKARASTDREIEQAESEKAARRRRDEILGGGTTSAGGQQTQVATPGGGPGTAAPPASPGGDPGSTGGPGANAETPGAGSVPQQQPAVDRRFALPQASPYLDRIARRAVDDDKPVTDKDPEIAQAGNDRANMIRDRLDAIEQDPSLSGPGVLAALRAVDLHLANQVEEFAAGRGPDLSGQLNQRRSARIINLGQKVNPDRQTTDVKRARDVMDSAVRGQIRKDVTAIGTAYEHLGLYKQALDQFAKLSPGEQWAVRNYGTSAYNDYLPNLPFGDRLAISKQHQALAAQLNDGRSIALDEVYKGATGGNAERGREAFQRLANWQDMSTAALTEAVDNLRGFLGERLLIQKQNFDTGTGGHAPESFERLFQPGGLSERQMNADERAAVRSIPELGAGSAPAAPAAAGGGDEAAARAWLQANPNDPRAPAIRRALGM